MLRMLGLRCLKPSMRSSQAQLQPAIEALEAFKRSDAAVESLSQAGKLPVLKGFSLQPLTATSLKVAVKPVMLPRVVLSWSLRAVERSPLAATVPCHDYLCIHSEHQACCGTECVRATSPLFNPQIHVGCVFQYTSASSRSAEREGRHPAARCAVAHVGSQCQNSQPIRTCCRVLADPEWCVLKPFELLQTLTIARLAAVYLQKSYCGDFCC